MIFKQFFERIVVQCVNANLVDGTKIFMDASLIDANASNNSVINTQSLEEKDQNGVNATHMSLTDPDASIVRHKGGKPKL